MDSFDKFTRSARRALVLASQEACSLNHDSIGSAHLLLGVLRESEGIGATALARLGLEESAVRDVIVSTIGRGRTPTPYIKIGLGRRAKKIIEQSVYEAKGRGDSVLGSHHLLLAVLRQRKATSARVLDTLGIPLERASVEVAKVMEEMQPEEVGAKIIDGKAIAEQVRAEARERALALHERGVIPGLALVLVGENPSSMSYVRSKGDAAEQAGLYSDMFHFAESTDQETVTSRILELNRDRRFHGILVQLPLPKQIREDAVMNCIDPAKDADGVTPANLGHLLRGEPCPWPATPAGVIELLHRTGNAPAGKHVVICGRSNIVGKPLAGILMQKNERANATVTMCHTGTPNLGYHTRQADILIAAMGVAGGITADMVKYGAVVIDVGNNWIEDASRKSGRRLVGDVDYESVREVASAITPVPGGVGPMTVAMLISNTVWLAERYGNGE